MDKQRPTLQERLESRRIRKPPAFLYLALAQIWKWFMLPKYHVHYEYRIDPRKFKGPYIVVSNHASRVDYLYTGIAFLPHRLNYVAGYNEFFRSHLRGVFHLLQVIPKKNFTPEIYAIREIARVLRGGGRIILFPEGMSSISGSNQPAAIGTGKLLKHFKVPVLMTHIEGGYLTNTKYCLDDRPGRVDVTVSQLFTPEDLERMDADEIQRAVDRAIHHDDYAWNKTARVAYAGKGSFAKNLHDLLYWCPRCGAELTMKGEGDAIRCERCGNGATLNEHYDLIPFDASCVIPESPVRWADLERKNAYRAIAADPAYALAEKVKLGVMPDYEVLKDLKTSRIAGEGTLSISRAGLRFEGTKDGEPFSLSMSTDMLPTWGMCTDMSFFTTYVDGRYYEFYPERRSVGKWLHVAEELHRINGGKWKNFPDADTYAE
ncbi:MAG: 1-acyl-sn-glycerol-3-phosphate acyltransferase [Candidatus Izemoplasmatales bacterium]